MVRKESQLKKNINEMKRFAANMPKTINEAINFEEAGPEPHMRHNPEPEMEPEHESEESGMDVMAFVDEIRKKSLKGMAQLADRPDDPLYEILKRIWQTCDKAYSDQKQASTVVAQQQGQMQQQQMPQRPM